MIRKSPKKTVEFNIEAQLGVQRHSTPTDSPKRVPSPPTQPQAQVSQATPVHQPQASATPANQAGHSQAQPVSAEASKSDDRLIREELGEASG